MKIGDYAKTQRPIKILQFGEGNFLRAFADYMVDIANEKTDFNGNIVIVKPISYGNLSAFKEQNCNYTTLLRGKENGSEKVIKRVVTSIANAIDVYSDYEAYMAFAEEESLEIVISNTTEAGIVFDDSDKSEEVPPITYPGKLTMFLYERYKHFSGDSSKGLIILPVELIDQNGVMLKKTVNSYVELWKLPTGFKTWLEESCLFCTTLVDRIVTGYPKDDAARLFEEQGYEDKLLVTGESFALWVIESSNIERVKSAFPLDKAGLPVLFTENLRPYKERKVKVLNGAHTGSVLAAHIAGLTTVLELMQDTQMSAFLKALVMNEIVPTVNLPKNEVVTFANAVFERFENPYIKHYLLSIALNSISKFTARLLPTLIEYIDTEHKMPSHICFSFAALLRFYTGGKQENGALIGNANGKSYEVRDDQYVLDFFTENSTALNESDFVKKSASDIKLWGRDLSKLDGFCDVVTGYLIDINQNGMRKALENLANQKGE